MNARGETGTSEKNGPETAPTVPSLAQSKPLEGTEMNKEVNITPLRRTPSFQPAQISRSSVEDQIERLIAILDLLDGDPDLEPELGWTAIGEGHRPGEIADAFEPNGDELDTSGDVEEAGIFERKRWTGQGTSEARAMLSRLAGERRVSV